MNLVFLLAVCADSLVDNFSCIMSCLWSLIWSNRVWGSWCLFIWWEITVPSSAKDFWIVTFSKWLYEVLVWNLISGQLLLKPSWLSNITKIPVAFKPELYTQFGAYAVFKYNHQAFFWTYTTQKANELLRLLWLLGLLVVSARNGRRYRRYIITKFF